VQRSLQKQSVEKPHRPTYNHRTKKNKNYAISYIPDLHRHQQKQHSALYWCLSYEMMEDFFKDYYWVYVLQSLKDGKKYTGYTKNLPSRFEAHQNGEVHPVE
jgi:hypothetical protein